MSPALTREERDAIRARAEAATPGPWDWYGYGETGRTLYLDNSPYHDLNVLKTTDDWPPTDADAEFIAHARTDAPALLDALDAAEVEIERLRSALDHLREDDALNRDAYLLIEAERDAARAEVATLRGRIEALHAHWLSVLDGTVESSNFDRPTLAHCQESLRHILRALAADEGERTGR